MKETLQKIIGNSFILVKIHKKSPHIPNVNLPTLKVNFRQVEILITEKSLFQAKLSRYFYF